MTQAPLSDRWSRDKPVFVRDAKPKHLRLVSGGKRRDESLNPIIERVKQQLREAAGLDEALKFNPNHEPAGSPAGGEFASADGGSLEARAKDMFGITHDIREAGYMTPDGSLLDLSGRHYAVGYQRQGDHFAPKPGQPDYLRGQRNVDHRELSANPLDDPDKEVSLVPGHGDEGLYQMLDAGFVRLMPGSDGSLNAEISQPLSDRQLTSLSRYANAATEFGIETTGRLGSTLSDGSTRSINQSLYDGSNGEWGTIGASAGSLIRQANEAAINAQRAPAAVKMARIAAAAAILQKYSADEPRDDAGRWTGAGAAEAERIGSRFPRIGVPNLGADPLYLTPGRVAGAYSPTNTIHFKPGADIAGRDNPYSGPDKVARLINHEYGHLVEAAIGADWRLKGPPPGWDGSWQTDTPDHGLVARYLYGSDRGDNAPGSYAGTIRSGMGKQENWAEWFSQAFTPSAPAYNDPHSVEMRQVLEDTGWYKPTAQKYNPDQPRVPAGSGRESGEWGDGGGLISARLDQKPIGRGGLGKYMTDDPTKMANLTPDHQADILRRVQDKFPGMTPEKMQANLQSVFERGLADPAIRAAGAAWYDEQAHGLAEKISAETGLPLRSTVGAIAALSPQLDWGSNASAAEYFARMVVANPVVDIPAARQAQVDAEGVTKGFDGETANGQHLGDLPSVEQASVIKALGQSGFMNDGPVTYVDDQTGKTYKTAWGLLGAGGKAIDILNGAEPDDTLGGHKVRSFFDNILNDSPESADHVTVDTHAISAALGEKIAAIDPRIGYIMSGADKAYGAKGAYPLFADAYRAVAAGSGYSPEQAQAIIWLEWRKEFG